MRMTVLGATGGLGRAIVTELASRGHDVIAASRTAADQAFPAGVRAVGTDLRDPSQAHKAVAGADVVVMAAQIPYRRWATELRPLVLSALDVARQAGARLVMVDNLYAYGSPGTPITVDTPETPTSRKGELRRDIAAELLAHHHAGDLPVVIGRVSDYFGPAGTNALLHNTMLHPAVNARTARTYIDADQPHSFAYLPDAARGFAVLAERPETVGQAWVLPAAPAITQRQLLDLLDEVLRTHVRRGHVSPTMMRLIGLFNPDMRHAIELNDHWDRPYTVDASAFQRAVGPVPTTPHEQALAETVAWYRNVATAHA